MKILLNCLPPVDTQSPSISLSILKSFLQQKGLEVELKYWNFMLSVMSDYIESEEEAIDEETEVKILPFLSILNDMEGNAKGNKRIESLLYQLKPEEKFYDPEYYSNFLEEKKKEIFAVINAELDKMDLSAPTVFGFSAKYNQWIPGMVLAAEIKKRSPQSKIIVGGFGNFEVAKEAMNLCADFDFTTWGEGEYPLLNFMEEIQAEHPNFSQVSRLAYREGAEIKKSGLVKSEYLDFKSYLYPDYSDYMASYPEPDELDQVNFPINTIRSCHWLKCKFCDFNKGYKLRMRTPECILNEIEFYTTKYGISSYNFVDSDTFGNLAHFEKLLDLIIDLRYQNEVDYVFWAEIIPNKEFSASLLKKMTIAGLKNIFIGYDGLSDTLLKKMNKKNDFADNIFFVKHSIKNGIAPLVNVIKHVPGETEDDVRECIDNLHYLRFFYNDSTVSFSHTYVELVLSSMSKYYAELPQDQVATYNDDDLSYLMPDKYSNNEQRFHLFRFKADVPINNKEWKKLIDIEDYYKENTFRYKIQIHNEVLYYTEYCNDKEIENMVLGKPEYIQILQILEDKTHSFEELYAKLTAINKGVESDYIISLLENLKNSHLVYFCQDMSNIVSVIHLNN